MVLLIMAFGEIGHLRDLPRPKTMLIGFAADLVPGATPMPTRGCISSKHGFGRNLVAAGAPEHGNHA